MTVPTQRVEVVVTGMGVVSPNGIGLKEFRAAQLACRSGIDGIWRYDCTGDRVRIAGEVTLPPELCMGRRDRIRSDRCTELASAAARLAVEDAQLTTTGFDNSRVGVAIGSGVGGAESWEENYLAYSFSGPTALRAFTVPRTMTNGAAAWVAKQHGFMGPCVSPAVACASGADALVAGYQMIASGEADIVIAGGAEAPVVRGTVSAFGKLGALSKRNDEPELASRPFGRDRDGFVIAEGAGVLVLESAEHAAARGVRSYAYLRGYGRSSDAYHVTMPHPDAAGATLAIRRALRMADGHPDDVGLINAHGTGTVLNDVAEAKALRDALGQAVGSAPVTVTKSLIGHALGASGAIEAIATVQVFDDNVIPPTANSDDLDPRIDLDLVRSEPRTRAVGLALSNSFAFGGHNVVLAFAPAGNKRTEVGATRQSASAPSEEPSARENRR